VKESCSQACTGGMGRAKGHMKLEIKSPSWEITREDVDRCEPTSMFTDALALHGSMNGMP
jgi:hypothetical protein